MVRCGESSQPRDAPFLSSFSSLRKTAVIIIALRSNTKFPTITVGEAVLNRIVAEALAEAGIGSPKTKAA